MRQRGRAAHNDESSATTFNRPNAYGDNEAGSRVVGDDKVQPDAAYHINDGFSRSTIFFSQGSGTA